MRDVPSQWRTDTCSRNFITLLHRESLELTPVCSNDAVSTTTRSLILVVSCGDTERLRGRLMETRNINIYIYTATQSNTTRTNVSCLRTQTDGFDQRTKNDFQHAHPWSLKRLQYEWTDETYLALSWRKYTIPWIKWATVNPAFNLSTYKLQEKCIVKFMTPKITVQLRISCSHKPHSKLPRKDWSSELGQRILSVRTQNTN